MVPSRTSQTSKQSHTSETSQPGGALLVGADWALAHGDAGGLAQVAVELAALLPVALRRELLELADLCHQDFAAAAAAWPGLCARAHTQLARPDAR